jgi:WD40 repeat protein
MQLFTLQTVVELFSESEASILRLQWAPDSRRLALGSDGKPKFVRLASVDSDSKLSVWNVQNGQLLTCCDLNSGVLQLQFCLLHLAFLTLVPAVMRSVSPEDDPIHLNCLPGLFTLLWLAVSQCPDLTTGEWGPTGPAVYATPACSEAYSEMQCNNCSLSSKPYRVPHDKTVSKEVE